MELLKSWKGALLCCATLIAALAFQSFEFHKANGIPNVTAPRIRLRDGRHMAYKEEGVPKDEAKYKIIYVHPFGGSRHSILPVSKTLMNDLGVYMVAFDRPGYGQSDPYPERNIKSQAYDIQDVADELQLGSKFHLVTVSIGGFSGWGCLKYIPHRLAGVAMVAPVTNFWWSGIPFETAQAAFNTQKLGDRLALRIAHYAPWLLNFWMTQKWFPTSSTVSGIEKYLNKMDLELLIKTGPPKNREEAVQQGPEESMHRDMKIQFGKWEFDPGNISDPGVPVHIWQGDEDYLVPVLLQRYIRDSLPWIHYHELPGAGHMLDFIPGFNDQLLITLLT